MSETEHPSPSSTSTGERARHLESAIEHLELARRGLAGSPDFDEVRLDARLRTALAAARGALGLATHLSASPPEDS